MRVVGLMSGTSADGVDAALVDVSRRAERLSLTTLATTTLPFPDEIRREILRRFPRRNRIACGMAARALEFHEKVGANTQSLRVRLDIGRNKRIVDPIQRRKITFDRGCLLFREVERWHSSR